MIIAKNIITAFLVLLLANPACCCAMGGCGSAEKTTPMQSCCSGSSDQGHDDENSPDGEHQCQCSLNKHYTDSGKTDWVATPAHSPLPVPTYVELPVISYSPILIDKPGLSAPPPPWRPVRILFSVFRL